MSLPLNQVVLGDCIEVMAEWPENSIDCIVCDPPYGIQFMGLDFDKALPPRAAFEQMFRVLKPGALAFVMSSPRQDVLWRMLSMLEGVGFQLRQSAIFWLYRTGFPKSYDVSKRIDPKLGLERKIVGVRRLLPNMKGDNYAQGKREYGKDSVPALITEPASDLAKKWQGYKSQTSLKPAAECILMVNTPRSEKTIVDNVLRWGTGAMNVDACRIPFQSEGDLKQAQNLAELRGRIKPDEFERHTYEASKNPKGAVSGQVSQKGRFPVNLLIQNGALDTGKTTKSTGGKTVRGKDDKIGKWGFQDFNMQGYGDIGDQSRYFDLDAWAEHHGFLDVAKPSKAERDFGLQGFPLKKQRKQDGSWGSHEIFEVEGSGRKTGTLNRNAHPCVKPVKLMAYLITLGCPPDGVVVDPFLGSGTTCIAAKRLRRKWIGIEINPEYAEIAEARINIRGPLDQFFGKTNEPDPFGLMSIDPTLTGKQARLRGIEIVEKMSDVELQEFLTDPDLEYIERGLVRVGAIERAKRANAGTWTIDQFMEAEE